MGKINNMIVLLFVAVAMLGSPATTREITNDYIKDAMQSLVLMVRSTEDKLERHEYRERQLGDQVKKALAGLEKKHRALEPLRGAVTRLDERLANVETILIQRDERERIQLQKMTDAVDALTALIATKKDLVSSGTVAPSTFDIGPITSHFHSRFSKFEEYIEHKIAEILANATSLGGPPTIDIRTIDEPDYTKRMFEEVYALSEKVKTLPTTETLQSATSATIERMELMKNELENRSQSALETIDTRLTNIQDKVVRAEEELAKTSTEITELSENMFGEMAKSYDQLKAEIQALAKIEKVMLQTADNVMDTKRRIEYGVHQILLEVGDLIKANSKDFNSSLSGRFDTIENAIVDSQTGALSNLTTKLETEMSQVWRQIGIMYQQLTASNTALDRLQAQTDAYVNGSLSTMDSMEGKVGQITSRMTEVDENLNYLLGRLSLVVQEFNMIKSGLGDALDNIRASFHAVQDKIKDQGPGPHQIPEDKLDSNEK